MTLSKRAHHRPPPGLMAASSMCPADWAAISCVGVPLKAARPAHTSPCAGLTRRPFAASSKGIQGLRWVYPLETPSTLTGGACERRRVFLVAMTIRASPALVPAWPTCSVFLHAQQSAWLPSSLDNTVGRAGSVGATAFATTAGRPRNQLDSSQHRPASCCTPSAPYPSSRHHF